MRFLVDAQLPPALARFLASLGEEAIHVLDAGLLEADDGEIWSFALENDWVIITKDDDFQFRASQEWVLNFDGKPLLKPRQLAYAPKLEFTDWHIREVFQGKYG